MHLHISVTFHHFCALVFRISVGFLFSVGMRNIRLFMKGKYRTYIMCCFGKSVKINRRRAYAYSEYKRYLLWNRTRHVGPRGWFPKFANGINIVNCGNQPIGSVLRNRKRFFSFWPWSLTSHSGHVATATESVGVKIDGLLPPNLL